MQEKEEGAALSSPIVHGFHFCGFLKWDATNTRCLEGRRSYRVSNFCEGPKITGRRVPDVVKIRE